MIAKKKRRGGFLRRIRRGFLPWMFLLPHLLGVGVFLWIPFLDVIRRSFMDSLAKKYLGIENYRMVWNNDAFGLAVVNTGKFLLVSLPLLLVLSLLFAQLLARQGWMRNALKSSLLLPVAVPAASLAFLFQLLFHKQGIVNGWLLRFGKEASPVLFLESEVTFWVLVVMFLWKNIGYDLVLWLSGLSGIPESYYEAAYVDGAGERTTFFYITLPLLKPQASMIAILSLIRFFQLFREIYLLFGSYPPEEAYLLQHLFHHWFLKLDMQRMSAGAVMMAAVVFLLAALFQWPDRKMGDQT